MKKEKLTLENIKKDLKLIPQVEYLIRCEVHQCTIIPVTIIAICIGLLTRRVWIGLLIFMLCARSIYLLVLDKKKYNTKKRMVEQMSGRDDVSITIDEFSHFSVETVHEPHLAGRKLRTFKEVTFMYFNSGLSWRLYGGRYYSWSKNMYLSSEGIRNISVKGNEFICVSLQEDHDIEYYYPCKFFELDDSLEKHVKRVEE